MKKSKKAYSPKKKLKNSRETYYNIYILSSDSINFINQISHFTLVTDINIRSL